MQLTNAVSLEGYLEKQSPTIFKLFQKRYFTYRNKGQFLVWFKKKPISVDDNPKGIIKMIQIQGVQTDRTDKRLFTIKYGERNFVLRAENQQSRDKWTSSLMTVVEHLKKAMRNKKPSSLKQQKGKNWKWNDVNGQISQKIRMQNQKIILNDNEDSNQQELANKLLKNIFGKGISAECERNIIYGFFKRKSIISSELKWYIMCTEFDLIEQSDDRINLKVKPFLEQIQQDKKNASVNNKRQSQSDSDSSHEEIADKDMGFQINILYQYDVKTLALTQKIIFHDILEWSQNTNEAPFSLVIKYVVPKHPQKQMSYDYEQQEKQIILQSNFMSEVKKWNQAIQIIYERYSIKKIREQLSEQRFEKYEIKMVKMNTESQWRMLGSNNKPQYLYLNKQSFKLSGFTFKLEDIVGSIKTNKIEVVFKEKQQQTKKQAPVTTINFKQQQKLLIVFPNTDLQKSFRKKIKKLMKKLESMLKKQETIQLSTEKKVEINLNTYHIDKKIKQSSSSIKINFYEMMQRDVSTMKQQKPPKQQSLWDRFLGMFCGPPKEEEYLY